MVEVDRDMDRGMGEVVFKRIDPYDVFVDPASRDFLFRDAGFIQIRKMVSRSTLMNMFPQYKIKIKRASGEGDMVQYSQRDIDSSDSIQPEDITMGITTDGEDDRIIAFYETYKKIKHKYYNVFIKVLPSPAQMKLIKQRVNEQIKDQEQNHCN